MVLPRDLTMISLLWKVNQLCDNISGCIRADPTLIYQFHIIIKRVFR